jgi:putative SOS response-associated peptidase YedK
MGRSFLIILLQIKTRRLGGIDNRCMCGRYAFDRIMKAADRFEIENDISHLRPHYNAAPGQFLPVVTKESPNKMSEMKWGLIPPWAKDINIGYKMINARAETVAEKPMYKRSFVSKRCLIPADGFYEWLKKDKEKIPFFFKLKSGDLFGFAGLYEIAHDAEGKELRSFIIITTEPNELMKPIHDRMPVILEKEDEEYWLNPDNVEVEPLLKLLRPFPSEKMERYPVSKEVNSSRIDSPDLIKPVSEDKDSSPSLFDDLPTPNSK